MATQIGEEKRAYSVPLILRPATGNAVLRGAGKEIDSLHSRVNPARIKLSPVSLRVVGRDCVAGTHNGGTGTGLSQLAGSYQQLSRTKQASRQQRGSRRRVQTYQGENAERVDGFPGKTHCRDLVELLGEGSLVVIFLD